MSIALDTSEQETTLQDTEDLQAFLSLLSGGERSFTRFYGKIREQEVISICNDIESIEYGKPVTTIETTVPAVYEPLETPVTEIPFLLTDVTDQYFTPGLLIPHKSRKADNIARIPAIWQDIDHCSESEARQALKTSGLPESTYIVNSGRGIHLYWIFNRKLVARSFAANWIKAEQQVGNRLQEALPAESSAIVDSSVYDIARMLRMPGSINSKNGQRCHFIEQNRSQLYDFMTDFYEPYVKPVNMAKQQQYQQKANSEPKPKTFQQNGYNRQIRADILKLISLRDGNMDGCRHNCLLYLKLLHESPVVIVSVNQSFTDPLTNKEVDSILTYPGTEPPKRTTIFQGLNVSTDEADQMQQLVPEGVALASKQIKQLETKCSRVKRQTRCLYVSTYANVTGKTNKKAASLLGEKLGTYRRRKAEKRHESFMEEKQEILSMLAEAIELGLDTYKLLLSDPYFTPDKEVTKGHARNILASMAQLKATVESNEEYSNACGFDVDQLEKKCIEVCLLATA